jgi:hypothetical protein
MILIVFLLSFSLIHLSITLKYIIIYYFIKANHFKNCYKANHEANVKFSAIFEKIK